MFQEDKEKAMKRLREALEKDLVDRGILYLLHRINEMEDYYTTSSCIGRCGLIEFPRGRNPKVHSRWLGKWHHYGDERDLFKALERRSEDFEMLVFVMNSPILHVASRDIPAAKRLLDTAIHSGLKASSIKSITDRRVVVEIVSTYKIDAPVGIDGNILVDEDYLKTLLKVGNTKLKKSRALLHRFYKELESR
ncbi:MAG TPA: hypothetical protein EYH15_05500 [Methanothermococcus okinawensis]|uniref:tRNA(Phe) 7-((3-amino-3-carboxypropyl)-4-demethylwyosine(37)-N(4))-methyltransferase n=1 Tax=Methanothermococcus okinawensis TaxID=155863 RepID=A0A832Z8Y3_9EURY|nr:hypothetical protein [Methanococcaceae archaeon]HIP84927.1 hypothetical protein [Methanothermococcus okinawensis]HIP91174.1 hypothetical protein [Methanothermococcus okinawensis]